MTRAKRLEPVQDIAGAAERRLAQGVVGFERRLQEAETKLLELQRYLAEYEQQFAARAGKGIGVMELRDYQAFLARLGDAIQQQRSLVQRAQSERDAERLRWQDAAKRVKALDHVVDRWQAEERRTLERREQRDTDERAQRGRSDP